MNNRICPGDEVIENECLHEQKDASEHKSTDHQHRLELGAIGAQGAAGDQQPAAERADWEELRPELFQLDTERPALQP